MRRRRRNQGRRPNRTASSRYRVRGGWKVVGIAGAAIRGIALVVTLFTGLIVIGQFIGQKSQDPIQIDSTELGLSNPCVGLSAIVKGGVDPSKEIDYYENNGLLIHQNAALQIDARNRANNETLKLAPYLVIKTTGIKPMPETADLIIEPTDGCGPGTVEPFEATLAPNRDKVFGAPQSGLVKAKKVSHPYFELKEGELEVFQVAFHESPGYLYRFKVGIQYSYGGDETVIFTNREFIAAGEPIEGDIWATEGYLSSTNTSEHSGDIWKWACLSQGEPRPPRAQCTAQSAESGPAVTSGDTVTPKSIRQQIEWEEEELRKYQPTFKLPSSLQEE